MHKIKERFWNKVHKTNTCWNWVGCLSYNGYGLFRLKGKNIRAHRLSYEWVFGPIKSGMLICHICDNRRCINPEHLFIGTQKDNIKDMFNKKRQIRHSGEDHYNHRLTKNKVIEIRKLHLSGISTYELARNYGVSQGAVSDIVRRKTWKHI